MTGRIFRNTAISCQLAQNLYLDPSVSYQVAQQASGVERLPVSEQTLRRRLREHGLLASIDAGRQMLLVRRTLEGCPRQVLHLSTGRAPECVDPRLTIRAWRGGSA